MVNTQTNLRGIRIVAVMLAIVLAFAGMLIAAVFGNAMSVASAEPEVASPYIEFLPEITGATTRYIDSSNIGDTVVVTYKITYNDGIDAILLVPEYDTDVFAVKKDNNGDYMVAVNDSTSLGTSIVTGGEGEVVKIELDNEGARYYGTYETDSTIFLTITYEIIAATAGEYEFGFVVDPEAGENEASVAYYINGGEATGTHSPVQITLAESTPLTLITIQPAEIEFGTNMVTPDHDLNGFDYDYFFVYNKTAVSVDQVAELTAAADAADHLVEYTYSGNATPVVKWYIADTHYDTLTEETTLVPGEELVGAPVAAGNYLIGVSAPATSQYYAVTETYAYVHINRLLVEITIADKSSAFGDSIVPLTWTANREPYAGDSFDVELYTTATSSSSVGPYPITGEAIDVVGSYEFSYTNGTYTITKRAVTLTALDQEAVYTGSEPTVDQTKYTITGIANGELGVQITKAAGVHTGTYTLTPSIDLGSNYNVTIVTGIFTITTQGRNQEYIESFFAGLTETYSGEEYDLLSVDPEIPAWITYVAENNEQTNANDYTITITVTLTEQDAADYTDGEDEFVFTKLGKINKAAVTLSAVNVNVLYGAEPVVPSFTVDGTTEEIDYDYEIQDSGVAFTPVTTTAVGVYDIVLIEGENPNFTVTYVDGTYTVSKATATVSAAANDVYYNRDFNETISASVNLVSLTPVVTYYTDSACTQETTPVNAGTYYVKAVVAGTDNYNGAEAVASFEILQVKLEGVTFTYNHGNVSWSAVENDIGKTDSETGVAAAALKAGTTISYEIYAGETLVATQSTLTFDAAAATTYKVVAIASDANYISSESTMVAAYEVAFDEGEHLGNPDGEVTGMPATQYIFAGQSAVAPVTDPAVYSCTFDAWQVGGVDYLFTEAVNGNITVVATWEAVTYTITLKYLPTSETVGTDVFVIEGLLYNATVSYEGLGVAPVKASDNAGIYYTFANKWTDENSVTYDAVDSAIDGFAVNGDMTFVAVFDTNYNSFTVTYYLKGNGANDQYEQVGEAQSVVYNTAIEYRPLVVSDVTWFRTNGWYSNTECTAALLTTMPAENISVYAGYLFDIGTGDVNGDGLVNANDITLYRQWIVGGYDVISVEVDNEWATATGADFDINNYYFLKKVADDNVDSSRDIRDVSITRMAIVGGYSWDIVGDTGVTGKAIVRSAPSFNITALANGLNTYGRARLYQTVTAETADLVINSTNNLYIDLKGFTLTVKSLSLRTSGTDATITVLNGTIIAEDGITVAAPNGNVVIEDVTAYVDGQPINLQAADSSLHFAGTVEFYDAEIIEGVINEYAEAPVPAPIHVEEGTHVVVEAAAEIVIEKIVVTENNFTVPAEPSETATITLDNKTETVVEVQGNSLNEISDYAGLNSAGAAGGSFVLTADINAGDNDIVYSNDVTIDLNGHNITFGGWGFEVRNGATLTFNGNGTVTAVEAALYAQRGGNLVVNGGTYTSTENFVIGTHGSEGRGNNTITINGGTFNGSMSADGVAAGYIACGIYVANSDTVTINAGTFNITNGVGIVARSGNTTIGADVVINNLGTNEISGIVGDANQPVLGSGRALVLDLVANYPGGVPTLVNNSTNSLYTIVDSYAELNVATGNVILGADINAGDNDITYATDVTIDLNGHNITFSSWGFEVRNGATLTFNGNGTVTAVEAALYAQYAGNLVINGGTYTSTENFVIGTNGSTGRGNNTITINGGIFNGSMSADGVAAGYIACGIYVANSDTVTINAGTFNITDGVGIVARSGNSTVGENVVFNMLGDNEISGIVGDANQPAIASGYPIVWDFVAGYPGGVPALTNNTDYLVIKLYKEDNTEKSTRFVKTAADLTASTGDVILAADIDMGDSDITYTSDVTIDLNGHNITFASWGFEVRNGATLTFNGNGTVTAVEAALYAQRGGNLVVNGGTYTSTENFVIGTHGSEGRGNNTITINAGTFNGSMSADGVAHGYIACGIYVANSDTVTINGGTFNITDGVGIVARSGNTTIGADVVFNMLGDNETSGIVGDANQPVLHSGRALILDLVANYPGGVPTLVNNSTNALYTIVDSYAELNVAQGNVILGADINAGDNDITYTSDVTIDLNGHNITFASWGFEVRNGATLTFNGNGTVTAVEAALYAQRGGNLVVNGGTYISTENFVIGTHGSEGRGNNTITINAGTFNGSMSEEGVAAGYIACGIYVANSDTVTINGGTFNITDGVGIVARSGSTTVGENVVFNMLGDNETSGIVGDANQPVLSSGHVLVLDLVANYPGGAPTFTNNTSYTVYTVEVE